MKYYYVQIKEKSKNRFHPDDILSILNYLIFFLAHADCQKPPKPDLDLGMPDLDDPLRNPNAGAGSKRVKMEPEDGEGSDDVFMTSEEDINDE